MASGSLRKVKRQLREAALHLPGIMPRRPRAYWFGATANFGDQLSPKILEWVTGFAPIWVSRNYSGKVLAVGSILESVARGDTIWGSGLIKSEAFVPPRDVTFLAVRGPLTRALIQGDVPEVYGDPAMLLPLFHRTTVEKQYEVGVVPHFVDWPSVDIDDPSIPLIDVREPWRDVVDGIRSCSVILSSSLHGLIVAEAYGIPASWIRVSDDLIGGDFKFRDYYLSTGRHPRKAVDWGAGISAALKGVPSPPELDIHPLLQAGQRLVRSTD